MTELDHCVLAVVWRDGPLSAYEVRRSFAASSTVSWSSSTGSIYPAIRRLVEAQLVDAGPAQGARKARRLEVTAAGKASVRDWLLRKRDDLGLPTADPIRTRVQFLCMLPATERAEALSGYREQTVQALAAESDALRVLARNGESEMDLLAGFATLAELKARLDWLKLTESVLIGGEPIPELPTIGGYFEDCG